MIQRALVEAHVNAHHVVRDIDVLGILAHQRALDVEGVKVGRGHGDHVGIQPHHQGDQLAGRTPRVARPRRAGACRYDAEAHGCGAEKVCTGGSGYNKLCCIFGKNSFTFRRVGI